MKRSSGGCVPSKFDKLWISVRPIKRKLFIYFYLFFFVFWICFVDKLFNVIYAGTSVVFTHGCHHIWFACFLYYWNSSRAFCWHLKIISLILSVLTLLWKKNFCSSTHRKIKSLIMIEMYGAYQQFFSGSFIHWVFLITSDAHTKNI